MKRTPHTPKQGVEVLRETKSTVSKRYGMKRAVPKQGVTKPLSLRRESLHGGDETLPPTFMPTPWNTEGGGVSPSPCGMNIFHILSKICLRWLRETRSHRNNTKQQMQIENEFCAW